MAKFFVSDWHLNHASTIFKFKRADGTPLRDFTSVDEMDNTLIENTNKIVKPTDTLIMLGDVGIQRKSLQLIRRLHVKDLRLVFGNHDLFSYKDYLDVGFKELYGVYVMPKVRVICTHIPIYKDGMYRWNQNLHGHLHFGFVQDKFGKPDHQYRNLSCEMTNYMPIQYEQILADMEQNLNIKL